MTVGAGQVRVPAGVAGRDAGLGLAGGAAAAPNPSSARISPTDGAVQRGALGGQPGGDLIGGQALPAQLDDPAAGRGPWPGPCRAAGPGLRGGANSSSFPARCSRTRLTIAHRV